MRKNRKTKAPDGGSSEDNRAPEAPEEESREGVKEWAKSILIAFVLFMVLRTFLVQTFGCAHPGVFRASSR